MSIHAMQSVFRNSKSKGLQRLVLLSLANYTNDVGQSWPSVQSIAKDCNASERSVRRALLSLEEIGEIVRKNRETDSGRTTSNVYELTICHPGMTSGQGGVTLSADRADLMSGGGGPQVRDVPDLRSAESLKEPSKEPTENQCVTDSEIALAEGRPLDALSFRIGLSVERIQEAVKEYASEVSEKIFESWLINRGANNFQTSKKAPINHLNWICDLKSFSLSWHENHASQDQNPRKENGSGAAAAWLPENWQEIATEITGQDCHHMNRWQDISADHKLAFEMRCREVSAA